MLKVLILFFLFIPQSLYANTFLGMGGSVRFVKDIENNFEAKFPFLLYGGYKRLPWAIALETQYYQTSSQSGASFKMKNKNYEGSIYGLWFFKNEPARAINPYLVGGIGFLQTHLESELLGNKDKDKSKVESAVKAGVGAWTQLGEMGFVNLEFKGLYSKALSPDLTAEVSARFGIEF